MRYRGFELCLGVVTTCVVAGTALAGPALDDGTATPPPATTETTAATPTDAQLDPTLAVGQPDPDPVWYGAALRIRNVRVPKAILELFLEKSAGGSSSVGTGVEISRRRGNVELQLGFEFDHLQVDEGVWIDSGDNVAAGSEADYVLKDHAPGGDKLGWFTMEFTFLNHAPINKYVAVRYGGGAGLGIITGDLCHCNANPEPGCVPNTLLAGNGQQGQASNFDGPVKYNLPPVFPVVNAIIGVQITPLGTQQLVVNLEGGIRTAPFFGFSVGGYLKP